MTDFLLSDENDLVIVDGDFAVGDGNSKDIELLLMTCPGNWTQAPLAGADMQRFLNSPMGFLEQQILRRSVGIQLAMDGFTVTDIDLSAGVAIEAKR